MLYLVLFSIVGYCMLLVATGYTMPAKAPIFTICFIAIFEYFGAMLGILLPITYIILGGGLISIFVSLLLKRKANILEFIKALLQPGLVIFFIFIILFYNFSSPVFVSSFDEFSHWALYSKYLVLYDKLPTNNNVVPFFFLPPISSLIQYYFSRLLGSTEGMFYWAKNIFLFATICCACTNLKWKQPFKILLICSLIVLILIKYNEFQFFNLYTDELTAFIAFSAFACYVFSDRKFIDVLKIAPIIFVIPLIRESAPVFGVFVFMLVLADQIMLYGIKIKTDSFKSLLTQNKHIISCIFLVLLIVLSSSIWNTYVMQHEADPLFKLYTRGNPRNMKETVRYITDFFENINRTMIGYHASDYRIVSNMPMIYIIVLILTMMVSLLLFYKKSMREYLNLKAYSITISIITLFYIIGLLYMYLFRLGKAEADVFASMSRYLSTIAMFIMLCTTVYLVRLEHILDDQFIKKFINYILVIFFLLTLFSTNPQRVNIFKGRVLDYVEIRKEVNYKTKDMTNMFNDKNKVYIIFQEHENSIVAHITQYELMTNVNHSNFYLGSKGYNISIDDFTSILIKNGYEYVFVGKDNSELWEVYGRLFDVSDGTKKLFKIDIEEEYLLTALK